MTWQRSSGPRRALPSNWSTTRKRILRRDPFCRIAGPHCTELSDEVDHASDSDDHSDEALRGVCVTCHAERTKAQSIAASRAWHAQRKHPTQPHPGLR